MLTFAKRWVDLRALCARQTHQFAQNDEATEGNLGNLLLSAKNRARCLERMRRAPNVGAQLQKAKEESRFAAVLIALCTSGAADAKEVSLLYTRRSGSISRHVRQIAFPGGILDPTDADYTDCALRETEEEIGLPRERVEVWGTGALITPPHTAAIMPVVGVIRDFRLDELHINEHEVDEAFTIPIGRLIAPTTLRHTQFKSGYSGPVFVVERYRIWGITGFLTSSFLQCLLPAQLQSGLRGRVRYVRPYKPAVQ